MQALLICQKCGKQLRVFSGKPERFASSLLKKSDLLLEHDEECKRRELIKPTVSHSHKINKRINVL